jgi:NAD(P)-dependent dehydrogenase (short-subunit alcohol dehydrogenase family)
VLVRGSPLGGEAVSSGAAINAYPSWGAYGASKAALRHLTQLWDAELAAEGVHFLSLDPGDMDTPLHALAVPDADPTTLKRPEDAARELLDAMAAALPDQWRKKERTVAVGSGPA